MSHDMHSTVGQLRYWTGRGTLHWAGVFWVCFLTFGFFRFLHLVLFLSLLTHGEPVRAQLASSWSVSAQAYIQGFRLVVSFRCALLGWQRGRHTPGSHERFLCVNGNKGLNGMSVEQLSDITKCRQLWDCVWRGVRLLLFCPCGRHEQAAKVNDRERGDDI